MPKLYHIDSFTDRAFSGNPAAVCLLHGPAPESWMQALATEMNLSETAFCYPLASARHYNLRWFTPKLEVDLCGHATLAATLALREEGVVKTGDTVHFMTRSGELRAMLSDSGITLDFPAIAVTPAPCPEGLMQALGLKSTPLYSAMAGPDRLLLIDAQEITRLTPDFAALIPYAKRGIIVTAMVGKDDKAWPGADFVSRCFGPAAGINEDPVTGSVHCALGPFWKERLNKNPLRAFQCSPRGGGMEVEVLGERVKLTGQAVVVFNTNLSTAILPG
ncbi:MAG: PhzF family phenazine biosynthesis isomerase [Gallionellaceae bacterium]|nr:PhzF family phenazine biosynthesis isomerase [Gallionellaceae bacterium]